MSNKEHEPVIEVEGMGCIEVPEGQMPPQAQPQKKTVKEVLIEDINFMRGFHFSLDETEKFGLILVKIKQDLIGCVEALDEKEKEREAKKNGNTDTE